MEEIKAFRKSQRWTQKNIAEYLEIPTITYIQWENGTRTPPSYVLNLIKYKLKNNTDQQEIKIIAGFLIKDEYNNFLYFRENEEEAKNLYKTLKEVSLLKDYIKITTIYF